MNLLGAHKPHGLTGSLGKIGTFKPALGLFLIIYYAVGQPISLTVACQYFCVLSDVFSSD
jgi:hypothetical protein